MNKVFLLSAACALLFVSCSQGNCKVEPGDIPANNSATADNPQGENGGNGSTGGNTSTPANSDQLGWPKFQTEYHDFGRITEGEQVKYKFRFTNVGKSNLIISDVKPTCGCTTPNWTKEVIPPGGEGFVEALFNSEGRGEVGAGTEQEKSVEVFFQNSAKERITLTFKATVVKK